LPAVANPSANPLSGPSLSDAEFRRVADVIYEHCGIDLNDGKRELVRSRLSRRLHETKTPSFTAYLDRIEQAYSRRGSQCDLEFQTFVDTLSTNLTSFYRERDHFDHLTNTHLPRLLEQKRRVGDRKLRGWSAGCSSGEEPYTIGLSLFDKLGPDLGGFDVKLLASDLSTRVLRKAAAGVYEADRLKDVPAKLRADHFEPRTLPIGGGAALAAGPRLRGMIAFRHVNLMEPWPFIGPFDFVFCRNVMIYFDKQTQQRLVNRYHDVLAPGGVLYTGHSESLTGVEHPFKFERATVYRK
jgi:chemotaxis protein methyltransferase CheR